MATHSSTLAWQIPWTEESGRLQSMGSRRVGHDWATSLWCTGEGSGNLLQCSCLENPREGEAWWAAVYGVSQSRTRLQRLSSSSRDVGGLQITTCKESDMDLATEQQQRDFGGTSDTMCDPICLQCLASTRIMWAAGNTSCCWIICLSI